MPSPAATMRRAVDVIAALRADNARLRAALVAARAALARAGARRGVAAPATACDCQEDSRGASGATTS